MKVFMFPGQGSQSKGMGGTLFDEFKDLTDKADKILGYSIKELCLQDPRRELNKTQFTQPALYVVNALSYYKKIESDGRNPDFVIGHSLGEFNALMAAECFDFEAGLRLVKKRGELMSQVTGGAMAAILNASKEKIESILEENGLTNIDLANYNTPSQIVISGSIDEIGKAQAFFQQGEILYYPLNTSGAFHSRFMQASKEKFETYLKKFKLSDLKIPVVSNVTARPYENEEILKNISNQISSTVKWCESIQYLMETDATAEFIEVGHGDVLTKIVATIKLQTPGFIQNKEKDSEEKSPVATLQKNDVSDNKSTERPKSFVDAEAKVKDWNFKYPVGTKVKSIVMEYDELKTRTDAVVLFGHRAAVYMQGYNGYFDLDEILPA